MAVNRGKQFEGVIQECFEKTPDVSVTRIHDQTNGYLGSSNVCDFLIFHKPYLYAIECKSVHGNTLSIYSKTKDPAHPHDYGNITNKQWHGLLEMSCVTGVYAGIMCWWIDRDVTKFIPIQMLKAIRDAGNKSISWERDFFVHEDRIYTTTEMIGRKKRIFFDYNIPQFLKEMEENA